MSYNVKHTPDVHDRSKHSKGNGSVKGRITGHTFLPNDNGISYASGMGCARHNNCFTCTLPDCRFKSTPQVKDGGFISNRGDGIKVWWSG